MDTKETKKMTDYNVEQLIGQVLRYGVLLSGSVAIIGGICYLYQQGSEMPHYTKFSGEPAGFTSFSGIYKGVLSGSASEIIQAGVVILIATPIIRIIFSLISFIFEKDKLYILITFVVLSIILFSMFGGLAV